jgi:hypothetical protein
MTELNGVSLTAVIGLFSFLLLLGTTVFKQLTLSTSITRLDDLEKLLKRFNDLPEKDSETKDEQLRAIGVSYRRTLNNAYVVANLTLPKIFTAFFISVTLGFPAVWLSNFTPSLLGQYATILIGFAFALIPLFILGFFGRRSLKKEATTLHPEWIDSILNRAN